MANKKAQNVKLYYTMLISVIMSYNKNHIHLQFQVFLIQDILRGSLFAVYIFYTLCKTCARTSDGDAKQGHCKIAWYACMGFPS